MNLQDLYPAIELLHCHYESNHRVEKQVNYLDENTCSTQCRPGFWKDMDNLICATTCPINRFYNSQNQTCVRLCPAYFQGRYCLSKCGSNYYNLLN